jgi:hypothetical protein
LAQSCACLTFPLYGTGHTPEQKSSCLSQHHPSWICSFDAIMTKELPKSQTPCSLPSWFWRMTSLLDNVVSEGENWDLRIEQYFKTLCCKQRIVKGNE